MRALALSYPYCRALCQMKQTATWKREAREQRRLTQGQESPKSKQTNTVASKGPLWSVDVSEASPAATLPVPTFKAPEILPLYFETSQQRKHSRLRNSSWTALRCSSPACQEPASFLPLGLQNCCCQARRQQAVCWTSEKQ